MDRLQLTLRALEDEKKKTDTLLYSVLPPSVANELRHKHPVPVKRCNNVTILFSGIVGFIAFCSKHASGAGTMKIVNLLSNLYSRFDMLTDSRKNPFVYKLEAVGDKYMIVSALPEPCIHHARSICHLALDMMEIAGSSRWPICSDNNQDPHRGGGDRCDWTSDASVLSLSKYCQSHKQDRNHRRKGKDKRFGINIQVSHVSRKLRSAVPFGA